MKVMAAHKRPNRLLTAQEAEAAIPKWPIQMK
jgi:hypothetical protein